MSAEIRLVTVCSSCDAKFYVTQEQLSAHHGDVRCGVCGQVFNAVKSLNQLINPKDQLVDEKNTAQIELFVDATIPESPTEENPQTQNTSTLPAFQFSDFRKSTNVSSDTQDEELLTSSLPIYEYEEDESHVKSKFPNWILGLFIGLLVALAAAQSIYYLRTEIASKFPQTEPYLKLACIYLNCIVELPQQVSQLMVDDSDLQEDTEYAGLIRLSSTIINNASFTQAYPILELTLTDTLEKPKLRRTFTPSEYLDPNIDINKGFLSGEEIQVKLAISTDGEPVVGYRVYLSY